MSAIDPGSAPSERLRGDEGELFARHHAALLRAVRSAVRAPEAVIEDACATAWAILLRRQPERTETLFGWLRTVAIHEAYALSRQQRRTASLDHVDARGGDDLAARLETATGSRTPWRRGARCGSWPACPSASAPRWR